MNTHDGTPHFAPRQASGVWKIGVLLLVAIFVAGCTTHEIQVHLPPPIIHHVHAVTPPEPEPEVVEEIPAVLGLLRSSYTLAGMTRKGVMLLRKAWR